MDKIEGFLCDGRFKSACGRLIWDLFMSGPDPLKLTYFFNFRMINLCICITNKYFSYH